MTATKAIIPALLLIGLGIWGWTRLFPSPEKQIEQTLKKLAAAASFDGKKPLARLAAINAIPTFFHTNALIQIIGSPYAATLQGKTQIREAAAGLQTVKHSLKVRLTDPQINLDDKNRATVLVTGTIYLENDPAPQLQIFKLQLEKTAGKWLIRQVETAKVGAGF